MEWIPVKHRDITSQDVMLTRDLPSFTVIAFNNDLKLSEDFGDDSQCLRLKISFIIPHRLLVGRPTRPFLKWCLKKLGTVKLNNPVQHPDEPSLMLMPRKHFFRLSCPTTPSLRGGVGTTELCRS